MTVALATLRNNCYTRMYNHLQTGAYAITSSNIHPFYNDGQLKKDGYPQVIINNPRIKVKSINLKGTIKRANVGYLISIYHNTPENLRTVVDEVMDKIRIGITVFQAVNLYLDKTGEFEEDYDRRQHGPKSNQFICNLSVNMHYTGSS